jgi:hypothetical protein
MENQHSWIPRIDMKFDSVDEVWNFWVAYGGIATFDSRKQYNKKEKQMECRLEAGLCVQRLVLEKKIQEII